MSAYPTNATYVFAPDGQMLVPDGKGGTLESPRQTGGVIEPSRQEGVPDASRSSRLRASCWACRLRFGAVRDIDVLDTPVGRLGIVISKDAWMMDVNDRFATKGANVILQPEAFSDWAFVASAVGSRTSSRRAASRNLQKLPEFRLNVDASMTGNFVSATFDGQSAIIGRKRKAPAGPLGPDNAFDRPEPGHGLPPRRAVDRAGPGHRGTRA